MTPDESPPRIQASSPPAAKWWWSAKGGLAVRSTIGLVLFGLAIALVVNQRASLSESYEAIRHANPMWMVLLVALPLGNVVFTALTFVVLMGRYERISFWEMFLLMLSAGLLNYLPLRPGMVGRVAYHRQVHKIRATDSAKVVLRAMLSSAISLAGMIVVAQFASHMGLSQTWWAVPMTLVPGAACVIFGTALLKRNPKSRRWRLVVATGWRWGDMLLWAARYAVVFVLVGAPITWAEATLFAAVSQAAMIIPLFGNGLGMREWAIGAFAGRRALQAGGSQAEALTQMTASGLTADLVNRAAELVILVPLGALAGAMLARRTHPMRTDEPQQENPHK